MQFDESDTHLTRARLSRFANAWAANPDAVSDDEFFAIQSHLLHCEKCCAVAKSCEQRAAYAVSHAAAA